MTILKNIWKSITIVRNSLANILFLVLMVVILVVILAPGAKPLPDKAPLLLTISGVLVDQLSYQPSVLDMFDEKPLDSETLVRDVIDAIDYAAVDKRITALVFNFNHLQSASLSNLLEIGQAIDNFKASGKPVIAYADSYSQSQYFLASYADTIYLNKLGTVAITGFGYFGSYFKEAADKLALKFHLFKVGDYKDAAEPYVRNSMSEASREHNALWITALWQRFTGTIEQHREFPEGNLDEFIDNIASTLAAGEVDFAELSKSTGLVDHIVSRVELNSALVAQFGQEEDSDFFNAIVHKRYLDEVRPTLPLPNNNIGLIVASGMIVDGYAADGQVGGDSLSQLIRQASADKSLSALVIRIDSGGGSAFASEVIREELANVRAKGLPVYVSMGSVAASGGYWIATAADEIWALPTTITGSIGVWGLVPNVSDSMQKLGIHNDGFGTTPLADITRLDRPLSKEAALVFQSGVEDIYRKFITLVAQARNKTPEEIHAVAQGRVWTGEKALEFGLVDQLGTLKDLTQFIATKLALANYRVKLIERPLTPSEQFLRALTADARTLGKHVQKAIIGEQLAALVQNRAPSALGNAIAATQADTKLSIYAHCLACVAP